MSKIITSEDLGNYMNKTIVMGIAEPVVNAVNQWVESRTNRCWGETKQVTRRFDYRRTVWLRHMDIVSIDGVQVGVPHETPEDLDAEDYYFSDLGRLTVGSGFSSPMYRNSGQYVNVSYTYGVEQAPDDLKLAALAIAAKEYNFSSDGAKQVSRAKVGSYELQYTSGNTADGQKDSNLSVIDSYRAPRA